MEDFISQLPYWITGPFWPEYRVANHLRQKGWKVYRNFNVYDPKLNQYAELDILAIAHDGLVMVEVKSYSGWWASLDFEEKPKWRKTGTRYKSKSPVWQVKRSRLALINALRQDFPAIKSNIINATHTYVFLDRGGITNTHDERVQKAWQDMKVKVLLMEDLDHLPTATKPAAPAFAEWTERYYRHFRWQWHYKILRRRNKFEAHIVKLHSLWKS